MEVLDEAKELGYVQRVGLDLGEGAREIGADLSPTTAETKANGPRKIEYHISTSRDAATRTKRKK